MIVGSIASLAMGTTLISFALLLGEMTDSFNKGGDEMVKVAKDVMLKFIYVGIGALVAGWLMFACWMISG
jgi:ATP-binding cassette, subfamily B (MDR/TAP), member 1